MSDTNTQPKKKWDDSASNYAKKIQAGSYLHPMYAKAGLSPQHTAEVASAMLYEIGIDIAASDLIEGGEFKNKDDISVYHAKKDKWISGRTSQKGWAHFHNDGAPVLSATNYPNGEELSKEVITLEKCAEYLSDFSMDMLNDKGWLKPEYVPKGNETAPTIVVDEEARARKEQERKEKRKQEELERKKKRLEGAKNVKVSIDKAIAAHDKIVASGNNIEPHANHPYLQRKYGEDLPHYSPYLKSLIASDITFASWAKPDEIYPLYQPGYDIMTGQLTALQRTFHDAIPEKKKPAPGEKTKFIKQYKEDGTPVLVKKFASGTNANNSATPVFNSPSENIKTYYLSEGITTGASWAAVMDMRNDPDAQDSCVLSCYNASNIAKVSADLREKYPQVALVVIADNDYQTLNNDGQKYANEAREEQGAIVVTPPISYLKDGQSDWDDVISNVREALTIEAQKEHGPTAKASFESVRQVAKRIIDSEYLQALNSTIEETDDLIKKATDTVESRRNNNASNPSAKDDTLLLAIQDPEFKKLTASVFNVAGFLDHSKEWKMPKTVASLLSNIDFDDKALKALDQAQRKKVLADSSEVLVELLTSNKSHNALDIENKMLITELTKGDWDVNPNYTKAFLAKFDSNVTPGRQSSNEPEPMFVTDFTQKLVEQYHQIIANKQAQTAQQSNEQPQPTQEQVVNVEPEPQPSKALRRSP